MKVSYVSDTHGSQLNDSNFVDVLVVAGDVSNTVNGLVNFFEHLDENLPQDTDVIYVPGNHDLLYSELSFDESMYEITQACNAYGVNLLYNSYIDIDHVRFYGTTFWSNLQSYGPVSEAFLRTNLKGIIADFMRPDWTVNDMIQEHEKAHNFLMDAKSEIYNGKKFVVTHFAPSLKSVHEKYKSDEVTAYFCNDMDDLVSGFDYWVHGHVHSPFDYNIGKCRVMCNPIGYRSRYGIENPFYKEQIIEV